MTGYISDFFKKYNKHLRSISSFLLIFFLAIMVRSLLFEPFHIPSGSMKPTLYVGDYIVVSKYSYGYSRYSFPLSMPIFGSAKRILYKEPKRGDVAVFRLPRKPNINYVKRIVGLPGDSVQLKRGLLYINDIPVKIENVDPDKSDCNHSSCYMETLDSGTSHEIISRTFNTEAGNTELYRVPEGCFFAMGDNRDNSADSRFLNDVGFIPKEHLVGKARLIALSFSGKGLFPLNAKRFWKILD